MPDGAWNHNLHMHRVVVDALARLPRGARILDVGSGNGVLGRDLAAVGHRVVGLEYDEPTAAAALRGAASVATVGDLLRAPFPAGAFDAVVSIAALHHLDARAGLRAMADLLAPGGRLVVVGLARSAAVTDFVADAAGAVWTQIAKRRRTYWEHSAPIVWPPPTTYTEVRGIAAEVLPGATYHRHPLFRYWLEWDKP